NVRRGLHTNRFRQQDPRHHLVAFGGFQIEHRLRGLRTRVENIRHRRTSVGELGLCRILCCLRCFERFTSGLQSFLCCDQVVVGGRALKCHVLIGLEKIAPRREFLRSCRVYLCLPL